jgi:hypothetical protein
VPVEQRLAKAERFTEREWRLLELGRFLSLTTSLDLDAYLERIQWGGGSPIRRQYHG